MDHSKSFEKYPLSHTRYTYHWPGASMTSSMLLSYRPIAKRPHMDQTILDPLLTLSEEKKSMRLKGSSTIVISAGLEPSNTSSNGRVIPKLITPDRKSTR